MRTVLCVIVLTIFMAFSQVFASEITTAQAQQLVNATKTAGTNMTTQVTLRIGEVDVQFNVTTDSVGNLVAKPAPGTNGIDISQVSIQMKTNSDGIKSPSSMIVIGANKTIKSYQLAINPEEGTINQLTQAGTFVYNTDTGNQRVKGGIYGANGELLSKIEDNSEFYNIGFLGQTGANFNFTYTPAGTNSQSISGFLPNF